MGFKIIFVREFHCQGTVKPTLPFFAMQIRILVLSLCLILLIGCADQALNPLESTTTYENSIDTVAADTPTAYDRALQLAEAGDPKLLPLCDSLVKYDSLRAGASPFYYRGIYHATRKEMKEALAFFDKTIVADYRFLEAYIEKAALLYEIKKPELALQELELVRTISPGYAPTHYWIGKINESTGQTGTALHHYQMALSLDSTIIEARQGIERLEK